MSDKKEVIDKLEGKKAEGLFLITRVCKDDLRGQNSKFNNDKEALKKIDDMDESDMKYFASKMADAYCNCCFWDSLEIIFEGRFMRE